MRASFPALRTPRVTEFAAVVLGLAVALGYYHLNRPGPGHPREGTALVPAVVWPMVAWALLRMRDRRPALEWLLLGLVSFFMAAARFVGDHFTPRHAEPFEAITPAQTGTFLLDWVVMFGIVMVISWAVSRPRRDPLHRQGRRARVEDVATGGHWAHIGWWAVCTLLMLLAWTPYLLVFWPGILVRDSWSSMYIGLGEWPLNNHHPVLFSLWVGACLTKARELGGGTSLGIAIFACVQAVVQAMVLGVVVLWLRRRVGRRAASTALVFFAISPHIAMWSITMHKDTLFVCWVTLMTVLMVEVAQRGIAWLGRPLPLLALVLLLLAVSFSRNNGPYIAAGMCAALVMMGMYRILRPAERSRRPWALPLVGLLAMVAVFQVQGPGYEKWGVEPGSYAETVGLPLHQVSWAVTHGQATSDQLLQVWWMIPPDRLREVFSPQIVDQVKFDRQFDSEWLDAHPGEFEQLWRSLWPTNRAAYAEAWFALSGGYVDPGRLYPRFDPGTERGAGHFVDELPETNLLGESRTVSAAGHREGYPSARTIPKAAGEVAGWPVVSLAFATSLIFWGCVVAAGVALTRRRSGWLLPFLPFILCVGTLLLASPVVQFRYVAAGHLALPVLLAAGWLMRPGAPGATLRDEPGGPSGPGQVLLP